MNKNLKIALLLVSATLAACNFNKNEMENKTELQEQQPDNAPRVTGIGGIFFFSDNPAEMRNWYAENLGLEVNEYGSVFEFRNANRPEEVNYLQWSPFERGSEYFAPSKKEFMINYRVQNIEALVEKLREKGTVVLDEIETYDYGKFVHILDPEGNKIELWEPVDKVLSEIGSKTTK